MAKRKKHISKEDKIKAEITFSDEVLDPLWDQIDKAYVKALNKFWDRKKFKVFPERWARKKIDGVVKEYASFK